MRRPGPGMPEVPTPIKERANAHRHHRHRKHGARPWTALGARVVKAFNTIPARIIELDREKLAPHRVSVFLCSDDPHAKSAVKGLAEELGFVGVDSGDLECARLVEAVADFVRFQIIGMGLGPFATISLNLVPEP